MYKKTYEVEYRNPQWHYLKTVEAYTEEEAWENIRKEYFKDDPYYPITLISIREVS